MPSSNATAVVILSSMPDVVGVYVILLLSIGISIVLSIYIIVLICSNKPLHSPANLLMMNTCFGTIFSVIVGSLNINDYFFEIVLTDWHCRIIAYLNYVSLTMIAYSYLIQAISRLFFTIFPQHRHMLNFRSHLILMLIQNSISFFIPLPSVITRDIVYRPMAMCLIPMAHIMHIAYFFISSYFIPLFAIIFIYLLIHHRVKQSSRMMRQAARSSRRDLELTRNILILFGIFGFAGFPAVIYVVLISLTSWDSLGFYMLTVAATCVATACEKTSLIFLNRDIRKRLPQMCRIRQNEVEPFTINRTLLSQAHVPKKATECWTMT